MSLWQFAGSGIPNTYGRGDITGATGVIHVGLQGATGATGIGMIGVTGIGFSGASGTTRVGSTGATGTIGLGSTGATGFDMVGATGLESIGATGIFGANSTGATGATGIGELGATGATNIGATGIVGATGVGSTGATGITTAIVFAQAVAGTSISPLNGNVPIGVWNNMGAPFVSSSYFEPILGIFTAITPGEYSFYLNLILRLSTISTSQPPYTAIITMETTSGGPMTTVTSQNFTILNFNENVAINITLSFTSLQTARFRWSLMNVSQGEPFVTLDARSTLTIVKLS